VRVEEEDKRGRTMEKERKRTKMGKRIRDGGRECSKL
jgi:hypothetical protein